MEKKLVDDTKIRIKKILQESGHIPDWESCAPLEDKQAIGYMDLEVSGDKESEVEDNDKEPEEDDDTEPDEEDAVGALEEEDAVGAREEGDAVGALEEGRDVGA